MAVLLESGTPMPEVEVFAALERAGASPPGGQKALRRACAADSCVRLRRDGRLALDRRHPDFARDEARVMRAVLSSPARSAPPSRKAAGRGGQRDATPRRCRRRATRVESTWFGSRRPLGASTAFEGAMDLLLWLDATSGRVRAFAVTPCGESPAALGELLETAIHTPLDGLASEVPRLLSVDVEVGQGSVEQVAQAHDIETVAREMGVLDAVYERLRRELESPFVTPQIVEGSDFGRFYARCAAFLERPPWRSGVRADEALRIEGLTASPLHVAFSGEAPAGLTVFLDESSALGYLLRGNAGAAPVLAVRFHDARRMASVAAVAATFGWKADEVPLPTRALGAEVRLVDAPELELLMAVMDVVRGLDFAQPFRALVTRLEDGRVAQATWPLLASPFAPRSSA